MAKYKWVEVSPGKFRLVDKKDPRPKAVLKSKMGMPSVKFVPSWRKYEAGMHHPDTEEQIEATDKFIDERENEMKTNPQAKRWEEGRKKEWARNKPAWRKKMMKEGNL